MSRNEELDPTTSWGVGAYTDLSGRLRSYESTIGEQAAASDFAARQLGRHDVRPGDVALLVSDLHEAVQAAPFCDVLTAGGAIVAVAPPGAFGGSQLQLYVEDFEVAVVVGMDQAMAGALDDATIERLEKRSTAVFARPDAVAPLRDRGVDALSIAFVGPMVAMECEQHAGAHFDGRAWRVEDSADGLVVSSLLNSRASDGVQTDTRGTVQTGPCACGGDDPRIVFVS
jgi:hypothetical protein